MNLLGRVILLVFVVLATYFFSYWVPLAFISVNGYDVMAPFIALVCAALVGWFAWQALGSGSATGVMSTVVLWATVVGSIGFVSGFIGPIIFAPDANQGPLLGIFITGPLGFVFGGVAGLAYALHQKRKDGGFG